jgi:hypothetical protein
MRRNLDKVCEELFIGQINGKKGSKRKKMETK